MHTAKKLSEQINGASYSTILRQRLLAELFADARINFTEAATLRLSKSSIKWLVAIHKFADSRTGSWQAKVFAPDCLVESSTNRVALEIRVCYTERDRKDHQRLDFPDGRQRNLLDHPKLQI